MLPARDYFSLINGAHENGMGSDSPEKVFQGKELFYIEENIESDTRKELILFTKNFVIEVEMMIDLGDIYEEAGKWTKEYSAAQITNKYGQYEKSVDEGQIKKWFSDHIHSMI